MDFSTQDGWKKVLITGLGMVATILTVAFGWSPDKTNTFVNVATAFIPTIATIAYFIVNQIAAKGKAQAVIDKIGAATATTETISVAPDGSRTETIITTPPAATGTLPKAPDLSNPGGWDAQKAMNPDLLPTSVTSLVKDRVDVAMKLAATDEGMWDVLFGHFNQRIKDAVVHMKLLNPTIGDIEAVQKVVDEFYGKRLDAQQCSNIQSILGLPQAIHAMVDTTILANIKGAIERDPVGMAWQKEKWRGIAVEYAKKMTVDEAANRVKNVILPMDKRVLALMEFGVSAEDAARSGREGMSRVWYTLPGGTGASPMEFGDGYFLLGLTP